MTVSNLTLTNSSVLGVGDQAREDGVKLKNATGTATLTNVVLDNNADNQLHLTNDTSTALTVNVTGTSQFKNSDATSPFGDYGILVEPVSSSNMTVNVTGATFDNLRSGGFYGNGQGTSTFNARSPAARGTAATASSATTTARSRSASPTRRRSRPTSTTSRRRSRGTL